MFVYRQYVRSPCFLIFSVTVSPACCSRLMASLRGFPFRLLLLIARIRSPTWIAPVLRHREHMKPARVSAPSTNGITPNIRNISEYNTVQQIFNYDLSNIHIIEFTRFWPFHRTPWISWRYTSQPAPPCSVRRWWWGRRAPPCLRWWFPAGLRTAAAPPCRWCCRTPPAHLKFIQGHMLTRRYTDIQIN